MCNKMKIAYLVTSNLAEHRGSTFKISDQVESWKSYGHEVKIFARVPDDSRSLIDARLFKRRACTLFDQFSLDKRFVKEVNDYNPDILYIRQSFPNSTYCYLQKKFLNVIEIVTDDVEESKYLFQKESNIINLSKYILNIAFRAMLYNNANGFIAGTYELISRRRYINFHKKGIVVQNSTKLDMNSYDLVKTKNNNDKINIFFIGSPGFDWHGIDKMEKLSDLLGEDYFFHIVGLEGEEKKQIKFYGYMTKDEYIEVLKGCQICLSTFALHRKKQNECTTIKVVEYLKMGFPVIIPYKETMFFKEKIPDWVLEIENNENVLENRNTIIKIKNFCKKNQDYVVPHWEVEKYISSDVIEKKRLEFIKSFLKDT